MKTTDRLTEEGIDDFVGTFERHSKPISKAIIILSIVAMLGIYLLH